MPHKVQITLTDLLNKEKTAEADAKILKRKFEKTGNKQLFTSLLEKEQQLEQFKLLRLKTNQELGNNKRIAELSILTKKKEALSCSLKDSQKGNFIDSIKNKLFKTKVFTTQELNNLLKDIESKISEIKSQLTEFNNTTKVVIEIK